MGVGTGRARITAVVALAAIAVMVAAAGCGTQVTGTGQRASGTVAGGPVAAGSSPGSSTAPAPGRQGGSPDDASIGTGTVVSFPPPTRRRPGGAPAGPSSAGTAPGSAPGTAPQHPAGATSTPPGGIDGDVETATRADPADFAGVASPVGFQSPSGNISCGFQRDGSVVCQIDTFTAAAPAVDCQGHQEPPDGVSLSEDAGAVPRWRCLSDVQTGGPTLPYGTSLTVGPIACASQRDGVTCVNTRSGNGFRLARESYQLVPDTASGASGPAHTGASQPPAGDPGGGGRQSVPAAASPNGPAGQVFWADSATPGPGSALVIGFQDDRWAYADSVAGIPECPSAGSTPQMSGECLPYRFDPATGALHLGPDSQGNTLDGTYRDGALTLSGRQFGPLYVPPAGTRLQASWYVGYANGVCGTPGGCDAGSVHLTLRQDGTFTMSGGTADSTGVFGSTPELGSSSDLDGVHGTYRIRAGGHLELTSDGQSISVFVGEVRGPDGQPDPDGPDGDGGLVLGTTHFSHDDGR